MPKPPDFRDQPKIDPAFEPELAAEIERQWTNWAYFCVLGGGKMYPNGCPILDESDDEEDR